MPKVLSIKQPWCTLIAEGRKDVENRTWLTKYRGRVLLHATAKPDAAVELYRKNVKNPSWIEIQMFNALKESEEKNLFGAIIGEAEIVDCVQNHPSEWAEKGVYNWVLKDPVMYAKPVHNVKGKLGLWDMFENDLAQMIRNEYGEK